MSWGRGGKYHNVGLSEPGRLSATDRQLLLLRRLDRRDYRGKGLTRDQASDLIEQAIERQAEDRKENTSMEDKLFHALRDKAIKAANEAGEKWMKDHPTIQFVVNDPQAGQPIGVHGAIGKAWITWPKRGSALYKWAMEYDFEGQKKVMHIAHRFSERLEAELLFVCERAAYEVYRKSASSIGDIKLLAMSDIEFPVQAA